jgi:hypothetical protein
MVRKRDVMVNPRLGMLCWAWRIVNKLYRLGRPPGKKYTVNTVTIEQ